MKRLIISSLLLLIIISLVHSCHDDELANDRTAPVISEVKIGTQDTIVMVRKDGSKEVIYVNTNPNPEIDTLILNKRVAFSGRFTDETTDALSSYRIRIALDSSNITEPIPPQEKTDTAVHIIRGFSLFGKTDTTVIKQQEITLPLDSLRNNQGKYLPVREGKYLFIVSCTDKAGNEVVDTFYTKVLNRKSIIANRE